jgi:hypothetical protein
VNKRRLTGGIAALVTLAAAGWWGVTQLAPGGDPNCYYTWASRDLPEVSRQVQAAVREIHPQAEAGATAFGEDCVSPNGKAEFAAMQTDFSITLQVPDLKDEGRLGALLRKVLKMLVERFPAGSTPGPQPGRVTFRLRAGEQETLIVIPSLAEYQELEKNMSDAGLYRVLSQKP